MTTDQRQPRAFTIEDGKAKPFTASKARSKAVDIDYAETDVFEPPVIVPQTHSSTKASGWGWLSLLASSLFGLIIMGLGLWITNLVQSFFAQSTVWGWIALGLALIAAASALAIIAREIWGLMRLEKIERLQDTAARALNLNDIKAERDAIQGLTTLLSASSAMAASVKAFGQHQSTIMDPRDRIKLADRIIIEPLDVEARAVIARQAQRVTLLTTLTPAAGLDILFVLALNLRMVREISALYGGRPSTLSTLRLARMILTHLAVAGGLALSDTLIQQVIGRGLLGRLSARFGEGAVNGILTTRVGLAAKSVCRPFPDDSTTREEFVNILKKIVKSGEKAEENAAD
jgi:putative membrane protein